MPAPPTLRSALRRRWPLIGASAFDRQTCAKASLPSRRRNHNPNQVFASCRRAIRHDSGSVPPRLCGDSRNTTPSNLGLSPGVGSTKRMRHLCSVRVSRFLRRTTCPDDTGAAKVSNAPSSVSSRVSVSSINIPVDDWPLTMTGVPRMRSSRLCRKDDGSVPDTSLIPSQPSRIA